jgi:hypothetical protein
VKCIAVCEEKYSSVTEEYFIKEYNTLIPNDYNMTKGGEGLKGFSHSEETRKN